jgi:hypothetical protein
MKSGLYLAILFVSLLAGCGTPSGDSDVNNDPIVASLATKLVFQLSAESAQVITGITVVADSQPTTYKVFEIDKSQANTIEFPFTQTEKFEVLRVNAKDGKKYFSDKRSMLLGVVVYLESNGTRTLIAIDDWSVIRNKNNDGYDMAIVSAKQDDGTCLPTAYVGTAEEQANNTVMVFFEVELLPGNNIKLMNIDVPRVISFQQFPVENKEISLSGYVDLKIVTAYVVTLNFQKMDKSWIISYDKDINIDDFAGFQLRLTAHGATAILDPKDVVKWQADDSGFVFNGIVKASVQTTTNGVVPFIVAI